MKIFIFALLSIPVIVLSWRSLFSYRNHGFYRFFGWIRHPLYGSLILLTWGVFLKNVTLPLLIISILSTVFFYLTALYDEKECIQYFGEKYRTYMKHSKMFIPFVW